MHFVSRRLEARLRPGRPTLFPYGSPEAVWNEQHGQRMDQLAALWRSELAALRSDLVDPLAAR